VALRSARLGEVGARACCDVVNRGVALDAGACSSARSTGV
jgi:hypothetical protein